MFQGAWLLTSKSIPFLKDAVVVLPLIVAVALGSRPPTLVFQAVDPSTSADAERTPSVVAGTVSESSITRMTTGVLTDLVFVVIGSIFMCIFFKLQSRFKSAKQVNEKVIRSDFKKHSSALPKGAAPLPTPSPALIALTDAFYVQVRQGNLVGASEALKEIEAEGKPTIQEYTAIINMCTKANDAETGHVWLDRAKDVVACRSPVCYNGVINAYVKRGELKNAIALAIEMKACRVPLDTVTYNTLIDGCAKAGDA
jgi:pentatricopeptide repeat protein